MNISKKSSLKKMMASAFTMQMARADLTAFCSGGSGSGNYVSYDTYKQAGSILTCSVFQLMCIEKG